MNRSNISTKTRLVQLNSEIFYTIDFFSKSNEIYGSNHSVKCSPNITLKNNDIIIDYSDCNDTKTLSYIENIFKKFNPDSIFTITDGVYRDETLGIDEINFSGDFIFYEYISDKKIIRGRASLSLSNVGINAFKKENFLYTPQIKISNNSNTETEFGIINYNLNKNYSLLDNFDIIPGDYFKFTGSQNNDNKLFKVHNIETKNDGTEIVYFNTETISESLFNSPVLIEFFSEVSSQNNRQDPNDGPPVTPTIEPETHTPGCLRSMWGDKIECGCECQTNCLLKAIQYIESKSSPSDNQENCKTIGESRCCYSDGCGARQPGTFKKNKFNQDRRGYGPYQINEEFVKDCAAVWCENKPIFNPSPNATRREPTNVANFCKNTVCKDIYSWDDLPSPPVANPPTEGETWPEDWQGPGVPQEPYGPYPAPPQPPSFYPDPPANSEEEMEENDYLDRYGEWLQGYQRWIEEFKNGQRDECYRAERRSENAMICCWSKWMSNPGSACNPDSWDGSCMQLARLHHCPTCECKNPPSKYCGSSKISCIFGVGGRDGNCSSSQTFNFGQLSRCDCYEKKMKYALCFLKKFGFIPASCTFGEKPSGIPGDAPGGIPCSADTHTGAGCFNVHCTNDTDIPMPLTPGCEAQSNREFVETDQGTFVGSTTSGFVTQYTEVVSETPQPINNGPYAIDGYYPLYLTPEAAREASPTPNKRRPGERTAGYHIVIIRDQTYYRPNGLIVRKTQFDGDYPYQWL